MAFNRFDQVREVNWDLPLFQPNWQLAAAKLENQQQMYDAPRTAIEQLRAMTDALPEHQERVREYINSYDKRYEDVKQAYLSGDLDAGNKVGKDLAYEVAREMSDPMSALNVARSLKQSQAAKVEQYQKFHEKGSSPDNVAYDAQQLTYSKNFEDYYDFKGRKKLKDIGSFQGTEFYDVRKELTARIKEIGYDEWEEDTERGGIRIKKGGRYVEDEKAQNFLNEFLSDPRVQKQVQVQTWYELNQQGIKDEASFEAAKPEMVEKFNTNLSLYSTELEKYEKDKIKLNDANTTVKEKQEILKRLGLYTAKVDGIDGAYTQAALSAFDGLMKTAEEGKNKIAKQDPSFMTYDDFLGNKYKENLQNVFNYGKSHLDTKKTELYSDKTAFEQQRADARNNAKINADMQLLYEWNARLEKNTYGQTSGDTQVLNFANIEKDARNTVQSLEGRLLATIKTFGGLDVKDTAIIETVLEMKQEGKSDTEIAVAIKDKVPMPAYAKLVGGQDTYNAALIQTVREIEKNKDNLYPAYKAGVDAKLQLNALGENKKLLTNEWKERFPQEYEKAKRKIEASKELFSSSEEEEFAFVEGSFSGGGFYLDGQKFNSSDDYLTYLANKAYNEGKITGKGLFVPSTLNAGDNASTAQMKTSLTQTDFKNWEIMDASGQMRQMKPKERDKYMENKNNLVPRFHFDNNNKRYYVTGEGGERLYASIDESRTIDAAKNNTLGQAVNDRNFQAVTMIGKEDLGNIFTRAIDTNVDSKTVGSETVNVVNGLNKTVYKSQRVVPVTGKQRVIQGGVAYDGRVYKGQDGSFFLGVKDKQGNLVALPISQDENGQYLPGVASDRATVFNDNHSLFSDVIYQNTVLNTRPIIREANVSTARQTEFMQVYQQLNPNEMWVDPQN